MGEEDLKLIVDLSRVRADIVEQLMKWVPESEQLQREFFSKHPPVGIDVQDLMRRIRIGNRRFLRGEDTEGLVSDEELLYFAKLNRYCEDGYSFVNEPIPDDIECTEVDAGGVPAEWQDCSDPDMDKVILYFHGGGYMAGSIKDHRCMTFQIGRLCRTRVLSVDYRLAPEYPYPAQIEDAVKAYKWLLDGGTPSSNVILMGLSAGGSLSLSLLVKLRELGLDLPAGAVLKSPATDFASFSDSVRDIAPLDPLLCDAGLFLMMQGFVGDADAMDPLISPIYADLGNLPPLLIQVGKNEMLYDHCRMFAEKAKDAGVDVTLQEYPDMVHAWHLMDLPETHDAFEKIAAFVRDQLDTQKE